MRWGIRRVWICLLSIRKELLDLAMGGIIKCHVYDTVYSLTRIAYGQYMHSSHHAQRFKDLSGSQMQAY